MRALNPETIHPPFSRYTHGFELPPGARLVVCAGQLGIGPDGMVPEGAEAQTALALASLEAILAEGGMTRRHVVRLNAWVTAREHLAGYMTARNAFFAEIDPPPASTLVIVSGFARPEFVVEVEAIAAEPAP